MVTPLPRNWAPKLLAQAGSGLIEVMVSLVVGIMVVLGIYGSLTYFQAITQTGISGNNALINASMAARALDHDIRAAGLGFIATGTTNCSRLNAYYNGTTIANGATFAPVLIQASNGPPVTITVAYATGALSGAPLLLLSNMLSPTDNIAVNYAGGVQAGNLGLLFVPSSTTPCTLIGITQVQNNGINSIISHDTTSPYNPPNPANVFTTAVTYSAGANLSNLTGFTWQTWQISNNNLQIVDKVTGTTTVVAENIVQLQAQYGISNGTTAAIQQWVSATGAWANPTAAQIAQIRAIRFAVVARSAQKEKPKVRGGACDTTTAGPVPWPGGTAMNLSANPEWQCYRYQVLSTVAPIKNAT